MRALTTADLVRVFDVTAMTIYNWRQADPEHARKTPLPSTVKGREVTFNAIRVKAWATKNGVPMQLDPIDLAEGGTGALHKKPGPKPAVKTRRSTAKLGGPRLTEAEVRKIAGASRAGKQLLSPIGSPVRKGTAFRKQADREVKAAADSKARKAGKTIKRSALRA